MVFPPLVACFQCISMGHILKINTSTISDFSRYCKFGICEKSLFVEVFYVFKICPIEMRYPLLNGYFWTLYRQVSGVMGI